MKARCLVLLENISLKVSTQKFIDSIVNIMHIVINLSYSYLIADETVVLATGGKFAVILVAVGHIIFNIEANIQGLAQEAVEDVRYEAARIL